MRRASPAPPALLRDGALVAFGTETVYGLGADATNDTRGRRRMFAAKGRPRFNPLICHYPDADAAFAHVVATPLARALAAAFWPGPLTLVLPSRGGLSGFIAGLRRPRHAGGARACGIRWRGNCWRRLASRWPRRRPTAPDGSARPRRRTCWTNSTAASRRCSKAGRAPSASNRPWSTQPATGRFCCAREACRARRLKPLSDRSRCPFRTRNVRSPGRLPSHYAPALALRLAARDVRADEALLAFGAALPGAGATFNLSETADLREAAARLFAGLRWLDGEGRARGLTAHRGHAGSVDRTWRGDQRPPDPRRRATGNRRRAGNSQDA